MKSSFALLPGLHDNVTDDSGLEIFLTPQLRKYDSGMTLSWPVACGLYYKCFTIVIYDHNNSGQYYKTTITILIDDPSQF